MSAKRRPRRRKKKNGKPQGAIPIVNGIDLDKIFCTMSKKYGLPKLFLKAVGMVESNLKIKAYRFEPAFWDRYLKDNPDWKDRDPKEVSASYGIMQIMFVVACEAGFSLTPDDLYNPVYNIEIGAKILASNRDSAIKKNFDVKFGLWPLMIAAAAYNGGRGGNPDDAGNLRNKDYVAKVLIAWERLRETEEECDD